VQREVAGFRRPLAISGRVRHSRQVAFRVIFSLSPSGDRSIASIQPQNASAAPARPSW
jgi:hypothetical protein